MKTLMENSPGLEKPTPLPPSSWVLWHGAPVCVRSQCANTQGSPVAEALLTNCSRSPACRKETAHRSSQHLKARTCSPLRKNVFYRREVSSERRKGMEGNADRTEPFEAGHDHSERSIPTLQDAKAAGSFPPLTRKDMPVESASILCSSLPGPFTWVSL